METGNVRKYVHIDFEFNNTRNRRLTIVCCSILTDLGKESFWLHNSSPLDFKERIEWFRDQGYTFVSFNVEAEASALLSLDIDPLKIKWIDLYLEYVMLSNHNNSITKGEQLIEGRVKTLSHWKNDKGRKNLAAALFKLCGIKRDTEHKDAMRDLIISAPDKFTPEEQEAIMEYCDTDVEDLPKLLAAINAQYRKYIPKEHLATLKDEAHWRAEYAVRSAIMVRHGYPVDVGWLTNLTQNIPILMRECAEDINSQFPNNPPFKWNKKELRYSKNTSAMYDFIKSSPHARKWEITKLSSKFSLALDEWKKFYNYSHDYPRDNFGAQMLRYLNLEQQLRGFSQKSGGDNKTFWDYVGDDGMVRPYMNIYGAQSSRSQPSSTSFLFLKTGWMRSLCVPPKGKAIGSIDYSSQEFLLGGLISGDRKMIEAYKSGDVYLAYGKEIKVIPSTGTKKSHGKERDAQKPVILGWQFWSTGYGLAITLNEMSKDKQYSEEEAQSLLDKLDMTYRTFSEFRSRQMDIYQSKRYLRLLDGFYMFGDNRNFRSVGNCPIQGAGACIMRKAVQLAQDAGLDVIMTLHDALYIMFDSNDLTAMDTLRDCMLEAFYFYFTGKAKEESKLIRVDGKVWSQDYEDGEIITKENFKLEVQKYFVDGRAKAQYSSFSRYFKNKLDLDLL